MNVVISAMAIVSSLGIGTGPFLSGWRAGRSAFTDSPDGPAPRAALVPELSADEDFAPTRRVRLKERSSALAVGTVAKLLAGHDLGDLPASRRGIVLGSALASIDSYMAVSSASLAGAKPYFVDHNLMPPGIMNYTSSQAAIRFDLQGPNVTVTSGRATGLTALTCGRRLVAAGRADAVLCGAFEEVTARRLRIEAATGWLSPSRPPGEGCCVFLVESAESAAAGGRPVLAEPVALSAGFFSGPDDSRRVLEGTVIRALHRAGVSAEDVRAVVRGTSGEGYIADQETEAIAALVPGVPVVDPTASVGDTYGASAAFGVAAAIVHSNDAGYQDGVVVVTSIDPDGQVACGVLRPGGGQSDAGQLR